jgi:hypothetical protein
LLFEFADYGERVSKGFLPGFEREGVDLGRHLGISSGWMVICL